MEEFLAREDEQDRFISVLRHALEGGDGPDEGFLFVVQGHGGIGKTELLNRFGDIVRGKVRHPSISNRFYLVTVDWSAELLNRPTDYASWEGPPIWVAFDALYVNLRDEVTGWRERRRFERAFAHYREQAAKIRTGQATVHTPSRLPDILGDTVSIIGSLAPVPSAAVASGAKLATDLTLSAQNSRNRVDDKDYDTLLSPDDALVRAFASGLREISRHRPVVLILDTAEILGEVRRRIHQAVKRSGAKTVWIWGIRLEEEANAAEDSETMSLRRHVDNARLRLVPLSRFDDKTIAHYLEARIAGLPVTAELTRQVVALTRGIPLAVDLVANLLSNGVPPTVALREVSATGEVSEVISGLARRYLVHLTETPNQLMRADLALIYGLALMNGPTTDPDLLATLWGVSVHEVAERLDELASRHDFVLSGRRRMHQEIQRTIRLFLLDPVRRSEVRAANERAVIGLRERMDSLVPRVTVERQLGDEEWCATACQLIWHSFWVNIRDGLRLLAELLPAAHTLAPRLEADLLRTTEWFEPVFTDEQRAILAGMRVILPSGPFVRRLETEFRRAAERLNMQPVTGSAMEAITMAADTTSSILAPDVPPTVFVLLVRLEGPINGQDIGPVGVLEQMSELLPATGTRRVREIIASRTATLARDIVGKPGTEQIAVSLSRAAVRFSPQNAEWQALLALACEAAGELDLALEAIKETCRLDPSKADWHIRRGLILRDLGRNEECLAAYQDACHAAPTMAQAYVNQAVALGRLERHGEALAAFGEACRLEPDNANWHANQGIALGRLERHGEALAAFGEACRLEPDNANWHANQGIALGRLDRHGEALAAYVEACRLEPDNANWHANRAVALGRLDRHGEALAAYVEACRLEPDNANWHANRAVALGRLDRHGEALAAYVEACRLEPDNANWHANRGIVLVRLNRYEEALAAADDGLRVAPDSAGLLNNRGESLMMLRRDFEAIEAFQRSINLRVGEALESSVLLALLLYSNDIDKARELCQASIDMTGKELSEFRRSEMRALAQQMLGRSDEAQRELRVAMVKRTNVDVYQPRLYELLDDEVKADKDNLIQIWYKSGLIM